MDTFRNELEYILIRIEEHLVEKEDIFGKDHEKFLILLMDDIRLSLEDEE